jgi:ankyrin repeat protein
LLTAVQNANVEISRLLLDAGADPSLANDAGWNPLYMAVKMRSLEKGTMPNPVIDLDGMYGVIELLVAKGADVNARLQADTEVHNSIRSTWLDEAGATPFLRASLCGDLKVMKLLLAHGADPLIATTDGTTALMALSGVGYTKGFMKDVGTLEESMEAMQILIDSGIDLEAENDDKVRAIHGAAHKNFVQGIQMLVDHGADLTAHSNRAGQFQGAGALKGNTVLDWADGFQTGMESAIYNAEAVELLEKLLTDRGLPLERLAGTIGGRVVQK